MPKNNVTMRTSPRKLISNSRTSFFQIERYFSIQSVSADVRYAANETRRTAIVAVHGEANGARMPRHSRDAITIVCELWTDWMRGKMGKTEE